MSYLPGQTVEKSKIRLVQEGLFCLRRWFCCLVLARMRSRFPSLSRLTFLQVLLNDFMHASMEVVASIGIHLFIKVVLIGGERLLTSPFHVLDDTSQSPFDFLFAFRRLINIPNF